MTYELQQRLNTFLLAFISVMISAFAALWWGFYGSLPSDVRDIREDVSVIRSQQGSLAEMQDARFRRVERDLDRLERAVQR